MNKFLENLSNNYWQLVVFIVVFVGYITFSFYMGINGFSFVDINLKQVVGLGLLSGVSIIWILFLSLKKVVKINLSALFIFSFMPLFLFKLVSNVNYEVGLTLLIPVFIVAIFIIITLSENHSYKKNHGEFSKDSLFDKVFIPFSGTLLLVTLFDISLVVLFVLNIYYLYIFNKFTHMQIGHKIMLVVAFVFIQPLLTAIIINQTGFSLANFDKQYITIEAKDKSIIGVLIYQNQQSFFISENNNSIIYPKNIVYKKVILKPFHYKNNTIYDYAIKKYNKYGSK